MCVQLQDSETYEFDDCFTRCAFCRSETPDQLCHMRILHPGCGSMSYLLCFSHLLVSRLIDFPFRGVERNFGNPLLMPN